MKRFKKIIMSLALTSALFLLSCEESGNKILGLWAIDSVEYLLYNDGELSGTEKEYYINENVQHWEFQALELLIMDGKEMELEQSYSWQIEDGTKLFLWEEDNEDLKLEISNLSRNNLVLIYKRYDKSGDKLYELKTIYTLHRVEEE